VCLGTCDSHFTYFSRLLGGTIRKIEYADQSAERTLKRLHHSNSGGDNSGGSLHRVPGNATKKRLKSRGVHVKVALKGVVELPLFVWSIVNGYAYWAYDKFPILTWDESPWRGVGKNFIDTAATFGRLGGTRGDCGNAGQNFVKMGGLPTADFQLPILKGIILGRPARGVPRDSCANSDSSSAIWAFRGKQAMNMGFHRGGHGRATEHHFCHIWR
jgi:hypothetical protein